MSNLANREMCITAKTPAWMGLVTTRLACFGTDPAILRAMTGIPATRTRSTALEIFPPMSDPARTRMDALGRRTTASTAWARSSSPTRGMVSTEIRSPRMLCRSASFTAPIATWATCAPPPMMMTREPKIRENGS